MVGLVAMPMVAAGCNAQGEKRSDRAGKPAEHADVTEQTDSESVELRFGALDGDYRRPGREPDGTLFAPLDLPTPNGVRLGSGAPGGDYWQQQVDYVINVSLEPSAERLTASLTATYHNNSPDELDYLWVQLEQNLFRPDSVGQRSLTTGGIMSDMLTFEGGYDITSVRTSGVELEHDVHDTLMRVELPEPIQPGEAFKLSIDFAFTVPPYLRRMGSEQVSAGKIFELAQWFPHICVYDDVYGWNTLPYLGSGEFYTNFGDYDVHITVPRGYLVSATGVLQNAGDVLTLEQRQRLAVAMDSDEPVWIVKPEEVGTDAVRPEGDGPLTWHFMAHNVRTFAWAASDAFIWDACKADVTERNGRTRAVLCQSLYPAEATEWLPTAAYELPDESEFGDERMGGSTRAIKHSIEFYSDWLFPYPYPVMSNINGPEGGMEYPMIVFCGSRTNQFGLFGVTDHEVGHSWFPMIVNTDERRHVWMDEGFNTFINIYSGAAWRGVEPDAGRHRQQTGDVDRSQRRQPIVTPPDQMWPRWLGRLGYRKTGLAMFLLRERVLGRERFDKAFHGYIDRWAFKSPRPADFFRSMEDGAGADLSWYWRSWFTGTGSVDQALASVTPSGDGHTVYVDLVNDGEAVMPVDLTLTYADGTTSTHDLPAEIWARTDKWRAAIDTRGREVVKAEIDAEGLLPDADRDNNVWEPAE